MVFFYVILDDKAIYTSEKAGSDETGDGSEEKPFKTALQALRVAVQEPWPTIYVDAKEEGAVSNLDVFLEPVKSYELAV